MKQWVCLLALLFILAVKFQSQGDPASSPHTLLSGRHNRAGSWSFSRCAFSLQTAASTTRQERRDPPAPRPGRFPVRVVLRQVRFKQCFDRYLIRGSLFALVLEPHYHRDG